MSLQSICMQPLSMSKLMTHLSTSKRSIAALNDAIVLLGIHEKLAINDGMMRQNAVSRPIDLSHERRPTPAQIAAPKTTIASAALSEPQDAAGLPTPATAPRRSPT